MDNSKKFYKGATALLCGGLLLLMSNHVIGSEEAYDEDTYGPEAPIVWEDGSGSTFSHKVHTMGLGLECDSCHDGVFEMEAGAALQNADFKMASFAEGKYCGTCHDGDSAFATTEQCASCHGEPADKQIIFSKPVKAVVFGHGLHIEMGIECGSCHDSIFKMKIGTSEAHPEQFTMETLYAGKSCGVCHNGEDAFASNTRCTVCHIGVKGYDRKFGTPDVGGHGGGH